jgi:hypothetical protein
VKETSAQIRVTPKPQHTLVGLGEKPLELHHTLKRTSGHVNTVGSLVDVDHTGLFLVDQQLVTDGTGLSSSRVGGTAQLVSQVGPGGLGPSFEDNESGSLGDERNQLVTVEGVKDELGLSQVLEFEQISST